MKFRVLSPESSARAGRYDLALTPFIKQPMDDLSRADVQSVALMFPSQLCKTEYLNNIVGFHMDENPSPILVLQPTLEMAETWSKDRLSPMLRDTPRLHGLVKDARARDSGNTTLHKRFTGGHITVAGANSPASLASRPIRVLLCDEIDRYPSSAGTEGDPVRLAEKRTDTFWNSVVVMTSTPTLKGTSRIEQAFEQTDRNEWFCRCPRCAHWQVLAWSQVQWTEGQPEGAVLNCAGCSAPLNDEERRAMVTAGEWRATAPFKGKRGYHLTGLVSLFRQKKGFANRLHQFAQQHIDAVAGGPEQVKVWTNTFLAESYEPPAEKADAAPLLARAEQYGGEDETSPVLPRYVLALTAAVDVQKDRLELEVCGWGAGDECWGIEYRRIIGDPSREEVWQQLDAALSREYRHEAGATMKIERCGIDAGFKGPDVHKFVKARQPRVFALVGRQTPGAMLFTVSPKVNKLGVRLYIVGVDALKDAVFSRLKIDAPGPRYFHWPRGFGFDPSYFEQLTAEQSKTVYHRGFPKRVWVLPPGKRNEALDTRVYNLAVWAVHLYHKRPNLDRLAKEMAARMKDVEAVEKAAPAPPRLEYVKVETVKAAVPVTPKVAPLAVKATVQRRPPGRGNFATRWR